MFNKPNNFVHPNGFGKVNKPPKRKGQKTFGYRFWSFVYFCSSEVSRRASRRMIKMIRGE